MVVVEQIEEVVFNLIFILFDERAHDLCLKMVDSGWVLDKVGDGSLDPKRVDFIWVKR